MVMDGLPAVKPSVGAKREMRIAKAPNKHKNLLFCSIFLTSLFEMTFNVASLFTSSFPQVHP
jgi:hypothetical protein